MGLPSVAACASSSGVLLSAELDACSFLDLITMVYAGACLPPWDIRANARLFAQFVLCKCRGTREELEQLRRMLDDSHTMLEQVRDALEAERSERVRLVGVLEHEQQRTQLLLDVLRHFKEKLQGRSCCTASSW